MLNPKTQANNPMISKRFTATLFLLLTGTLFSVLQAQSIKIIIKDGGRTPLPGATVQLIQLPDSLRHAAITNTQGVASFEKLKTGLHLARISYIGYETLEKTINVRSENRNLEYQLKESVTTLGEVNIVAKRPLITQEDDKMIIDPEPLVNISTNTLEVLESTPGLYVDQDGGIFLSSATPAVVYINGREQKMSSQDINTILRSLPPSSIQRIEVMRTPSAKYDAASSGGIINIVLKKGVKIGRFGSITSGANQGFYGNQFLGFSLNNSGDKSTSYINLNLSNNQMREVLNTNRVLNPESHLTQSAITRRSSQQAYTGFGFNYEIRQGLNFNYDGRVNASLPSNNSLNTNLIENPDKLKLSEALNMVNNDSKFLSIQQDLGLNLKLDTLGSEWDNKFSYSYNYNNGFQSYETRVNFPFQTSALGEGDNMQYRHFLQFQSDLTRQLPWKFKMETGIKSTLQDYNSDAEFISIFNGSSVNDPLRTNAFNYLERINSAYLQFSRPMPGKLLIKAGARMEHTYMRGNQTIPADTSFVVNRADWFPYLYLSRPLVKIQGFELKAFLIYRKTITRPDYQNLNPYVKFVDQFLYEAGNPALKPQFAHNFEANISMDDMPIFAIGQNYTTDIFSGVVYQDPNQPNVAVRTFDNLGKSKETYFRAMAGIPPGGFYFFMLGTQYNLNEYDGFYDNNPLIYTRGSWRFFTFHNFRLHQNTRFTIFGFMMTKGQFYFYELGTFGQLNMALHQSFMNKRLNISLSARDVLRSMVVKFNLNQGSMNAYGDRYTDNQRFGINIRYTFGIKSKEERQNMMRFEMPE